MFTYSSTNFLWTLQSKRESEQLLKLYLVLDYEMVSILKLYLPNYNNIYLQKRFYKANKT